MPANLNAPFGLRPMRYRSGAPYNGAVNPYSIGTGDGTALFLGDAVMFAADSNAAAQGDGRHQPGALPIVTRAAGTAGSRTVGVVCGVEWVTRDSLTYRPANIAAVIYVADDPDLVFWIQDDGAATPGATLAGLNATINFATAGSVVSGRSGATATFTTADMTAPLHMMNIARLPNNDVAFDFATWEVTLNTHAYQGGVLGTTLGL